MLSRFPLMAFTLVLEKILSGWNQLLFHYRAPRKNWPEKWAVCRLRQPGALAWPNLWAPHAAVCVRTGRKPVPLGVWSNFTS